jgi:archaellum biogenesis protein FlaJ (TadC family)
MIGTKYLSDYFSPLKEEILKSNMNMLFELYVGKMLLVSFLSFFIALISVSAAMTFLGFQLVISLFSGLITAITSSFIILTIYHSYPFQLLTTKRNSIENSMPFAINHMGAIASSNIPPFTIFKLLSNVPEYGEIRNESERIVRNTETFGMDITAAIKNVAERTPSHGFRQFLLGFVSTIEIGGDLKKFLENAAKDALFDYRIKRERYLQTLSTYADFYTAVLIAAPLFFVSILSVMSLIGGEVLGMSIPMAMRVGIYLLIPALNIIFIAFIHFTQVKI